MTDKSGSAKPLGHREREALRDIRMWYGSSYIWRQSSMKKLEARGLVRKSGRVIGKDFCYQITQQGLEYNLDDNSK